MQRIDIADGVYRPIKDRAQLKAPLILASRRADHSAVPETDEANGPELSRCWTMNRSIRS
jgi:hypothetical protein